MIRSFKTTGTEDIFNGDNTQAARKTCPQSLWKIAARKLDLLDSVRWLDELSVPPGNRLEALYGDPKFFGVSADFWLNLQLRWDLYHAQQSEQNELERIKTRQPSFQPAPLAA